jgi:ketosteroid isomerase-like protein
MSEENVEAFRRAVEAYNRRDVEAFLAEFDPMVETQPLTLVMFGQEATVYRGHGGIRQFIREVDEVLAEVRIEPLEIRDLGERVVARGHLRGRGRTSGVETESPISWVVDFKNDLVIRMRDYLDFNEALEAAGLRE